VRREQDAACDTERKAHQCGGQQRAHCPSRT
jgi:hypothetical protein